MGEATLIHVEKAKVTNNETEEDWKKKKIKTMDSKGSFYREGSIYVANDKKSCICDGELKTRGGTSINLPLLK